jgi:putative ABC transport system permease protein
VQSGLQTSSLTPDDAQALSNKGFVPDGVTAVPTVGLHTALTALTRSMTTDVIGSTPDFTQVQGYTIQSGRFLTAADVAAAQPVVVVGPAVVRQLFAGDNPLGQQVQIGNHFFQVVGVFTPRGFSGSFDQDDLAVMPVTAAWSDLLGGKSVIDQVLIQATSPAKAAAVKAEATTTLLQRHGFTNPAQADFEVHTVHDLDAEAEQSAAAVEHTLLLAAVVLLIGAAIHLHTLLSSPTGADPAPTLAGVVTRALVATVVGMALAVAVAGPIRHLIGGIAPLSFRLSALAWAAVAGLLVGIAAWFPAAVRSAQQEPRVP